jgi:hypothetical protein
MKIKIVPASELSTKTLRAKDYVLSPVKVTITEEIETDYIVHIGPVDTSDEAQSMLEEMDEASLMTLLKKSKKVDRRVTERWVVSAIVEG